MGSPGWPSPLIFAVCVVLKGLAARRHARKVPLREIADATIQASAPAACCHLRIGVRGFEERVARTAVVAVRGSSLAIIFAVSYGIAVSKLRRPFLSDRYFLITVRLLRW